MASPNPNPETNPSITMAAQSQELPPAYTPDRLTRPTATHTAPPTPAYTVPRPTDSSASSIRDFAPTYPPPHTDATLPPYTHSSTASRALLGGFRSETAYLDALRSWAADKQYMEPLKDVKGREVSLTGFYGNMTSEDYIRREQARRRGGAVGMREWKRSLGGVGAAGVGSSRRGTAPAVLQRGSGAGPLGGGETPVLGGEEDEISDDELYREGSRADKSDHAAEGATQQRRRKGSLIGWLRRKRGDSVAGA